MSVKLIRLSKSCIGPEEKRAVASVLDREYLGMGAEVQEFENRLTEFFSREVVCVSTGTAALHLAVQACQIGPGDEVLVPSLTYVASYQAISATGARPVSCEVDPEDCLLDLSDAARRISSKTKAVMPVHYSGGVGNLEAVYKFAEQHGLRVIEDAAHAFGTVHKGKKIGSYGDIVCFSFDGIKNITSGEGGCVVTNDEAILTRIRDARLLGVEKDSDKRFAGQRSWEFDVGAQGWRYHMSNIMAAIGIEQLKRFPEFSTKRRELAKLYDSLLKNAKRIKTLNRDYDSVVPHIYPIRIGDLPDREALRKRLLDYGIQTGLHYQPNHQLSFYASDPSPSLPVTEKIYSELLTLPLHPDLDGEDVRYVSEMLLKELNHVG